MQNRLKSFYNSLKHHSSRRVKIYMVASWCCELKFVKILAHGDKLGIGVSHVNIEKVFKSHLAIKAQIYMVASIL
jgi:hypothetical protein